MEKTAAISPSRRAAFAILEQVTNSSAHADDLLRGAALDGLSQVDRNLATALVLGVLRWQIALDAELLPLLQRPDQRLASPVATALRLGAFQLRHMDRIPAHAALSESVELVRASGNPHAAGMVNALLRNLQRASAPKAKLFETPAAFAQRLGHPRWIVERWGKAYGREAAFKICESDQVEPSNHLLFVGDTEDSALPSIDDGSRLVAELAAASVAAPQRIWDCCAAPGGKTLVLAARHPQAALLATDVQPRRLAALRSRLQESAPQATVLQADAAKLPESEDAFDLILCDVPCSGTGTLGRNPEIRHRLQPAELGRQAARQREILAAALRRLAPGGRLLYSTCSLEPEENEQVVAAVMAALGPTAGIAQCSLEPVLERLRQSGLLAEGVSLEGVLRDGCLRTLPGVNLAGDGFFAALFERT